jgi:hypothetical protein
MYRANIHIIFYRSTNGLITGIKIVRIRKNIENE